MKKTEQQFSQRQFMLSGDFEFFHYLDARPVDVQYHSHDFYEIYFFLSGKVSYVIEGKTYHLHPGDILLTNNRELHKPLVENGRVYERFVLWLNPGYLQELGGGKADLSQCFEASAQCHRNLLQPQEETLQTVRRLFDRLEYLSDRQEFGAPVLRRAYLMELLVAVNTAYFGSGAILDQDIVYNQKISDLLRYINENLCEDLSLDELAQRFYLSKYHLSRQFKEHVGLTLHQYILKKRLISAKLLLLDGAGVADAFEVSGFGDYSNFLKAFKTEFGLSPKKFSEEARMARL